MISVSLRSHRDVVAKGLLVAVTLLVSAAGWAQGSAPAAPAAQPAPATPPAPPAAATPPAAPAPAAIAAPDAAPASVAPAVTTVVLVADADDLVAEVKASSGETRMVGLKKGDNKVEVAQGPLQVSVQTKGGRKVIETTMQADASGGRLAITSRGRVLVQVPADADVSLDGKDVAAEGGQFSVSAEPGSHTLMVQRAGHFGQKGSIEVSVGKTTTVPVAFEGWDAGGKKTWAWAAMLGGGALILSAVTINAVTKFDEFGGDPVRWTLFGLGTAGFVGGTVLLKHAMDEEAPVRDTRFSVQVARTGGGAMASVGWKF